ncbi:MGMT family protein [Candidatus Woesearchaeota archaeon]|nr:MGMT family protein [Candidatus Woesearchaeota archaeon]
MFALVVRIPVGRVTTYKALAAALGTHPRAIGQALKRNKHPQVIPCHRIVHSDGTLGGYFGQQHAIKKQLLEREGIVFDGRKIRDFVPYIP